MRFRGKSIRRKIVALLLVPLVSLTGIWAFATVLTGREVNQLFDTTFIVQEIGYPTEDVISVLQDERRQALVYLADPRASDALTDLRRTRTATDEVVSKIRRNAGAADVRDELGPDATERLTAILDAFDGVGSLRQSVEDGTVTRAQALDLYNRLVDPCYILLANLRVLDDVDVDKEGRALVNMSRARELLAREDALLGSSLVVGRVTRDEARDISDLVAQRTLMYEINLPQLPSVERTRYERYWKNASTAPLRVAEQSVLASSPGTPDGVSARSWDGLADGVLDGLDKLNTQAGDRFQDRVRPVAVGVIVKAAIAGVLGLAAVLVSLFMSVRMGRGLIRDLRRLRREAHETAEVRLPSVMRRLSAGEQVDVETEVPRLEYEKNEIGEVSQALNSLQRSAVEAAVKQSELRSGVSEVFVNLARRSQVLLHKQLTLLDTMERRTEDTDELADLFRLDHLTTRMRRHAEGLVILSGAAPSRQWRKPVQLMDVVRAAVAEVEDYERIEVRRLPRMAVTGSAVADLTHLVAELLENATVFSPPHTAVQVLGERVANGFTLEIHDRGLGMAAEALLDANLRLAETPEFELSDTDRLGLFVVSRLAQRQNVRVSLQPSPYGGTTAVVFVPDALLSDEVPDTNGVGFRLDRAPSAKGAQKPRSPKGTADDDRRTALSQVPVTLPGLSTSILDGPVELEAPVDLDALDDFPGPLDDGTGRGGVFRPRRSRAGTTKEEWPEPPRGPAPSDGGDGRPAAPLPRRRAPKLVSSHGRPVTRAAPRREGTADRQDTGEVTELPRPAGEAPERSGVLEELPKRSRGATRGPAGRETGDRPAGAGEEAGAGEGRGDRDRPPALPRPGARRGIEAGSTRPAAPVDSGDTRPDASAAGGTGPLPRRVRQASLAPQLKEGPEEGTASGAARPADPTDRDADEVRNRMASLQRGWQRGREENAEGDRAQDGTAPGTTKGDGR
ncbi:nitrate- and nitrite sensing domain-containing protein [Streptomyces beigongshangae]|uniref:nitrate- and nitrite sensing domain-containing protein n=1 Tax=Streptomyces beigongshangae TaxID=2841597 RepID=UPI001C846D0A|nr:nitrate- and nitrite sensing domain-containing protein [Streptomyces sp. REN17]